MARKVMFASDRVRQASKRPVTVSPDLDREKKLAVMRGYECACGHWDSQPDSLGYCRSLECAARRLKHAQIGKYCELTVIVYGDRK
jgi:hypothetical protein